MVQKPGDRTGQDRVFYCLESDVKLNECCSIFDLFFLPLQLPVVNQPTNLIHTAQQSPRLKVFKREMSVVVRSLPVVALWPELINKEATGPGWAGCVAKQRGRSLEHAGM
jgi:hypothetical protein